MTMPASDPERVFRRHRDEVYRWAMRLLGRHHDANDVVQDVFVRWFVAYRNDSPVNARSWLRRVTMNRAIDLIRQAERGRDAHAPLAVLRRDDVRCDPPPADQAELREAILAALDTLTESQRDVLMARVFDDQTFAAIAHDQQVAVPTVKTHYLRAVRTLRDQFERRGLMEPTDE